MVWEFYPLNLRVASETEYQQLSRFKNRIQAEAYPDDPAVPLEEHLQEWKALPASADVVAYCLPDQTGAEVIAYCEASVAHTDNNVHIGEFTIEVLPERRQQGIARKALTILLPFFARHQRTLLTSRTCSNAPAGEFFLERIHARKGLTFQMTQCTLTDMDKSLLDTWLAQNENKKTRFASGFYDGSCPDELIERMAAVRQVVVVGWDGLRPDFVSPQHTPTLHELARRGTFFRQHHCSYVSSTEVNGTALATGAHPAHSGILANAHSISSKETMNLLSLMRLGVDLGVFTDLDRAVVDELFITTQPAHLQKMENRKLASADRDVKRAELVRFKLSKAQSA